MIITPTLSWELIDPGLVHLILVTDTVLLSTILQNHCWGDGLHVETMQEYLLS